MHEAPQNLGTLDKPHNITFLMVYSTLCYSTPLHPFSTPLCSSLSFSPFLSLSLPFSPFLSLSLPFSPFLSLSLPFSSACSFVLFSSLLSCPLLYSSLACSFLLLPTLVSPLYSCLSPSLFLPCSSLIFSTHAFPFLLLSVLLF